MLVFTSSLSQSKLMVDLWQKHKPKFSTVAKACLLGHMVEAVMSTYVFFVTGATLWPQHRVRDEGGNYFEIGLGAFREGGTHGLCFSMESFSRRPGQPQFKCWDFMFLWVIVLCWMLISLQYKHFYTIWLKILPAKWYYNAFVVIRNRNL